jgi:hypothetical protein
LALQLSEKHLLTHVLTTRHHTSLHFLSLWNHVQHLYFHQSSHHYASEIPRQFQLIVYLTHALLEKTVERPSELVAGQCQYWYHNDLEGEHYMIVTSSFSQQELLLALVLASLWQVQHLLTQDLRCVD